MPTYEFKCPKGHGFEKFYATITNTRRLKCPTCGKMARRLISGGAGLVFKGSGFYITDYGKDGKGPRKEKDTDKPAAESKPDTPAKTDKPEAKPAAKAESKSTKKAAPE